MESNKIDLSIVIPTYNEERDLASCLSSIERQTYKKSRIEVIIVDNYSTDKTVDIVKGFSKSINIILLKSKIKDAEVSKKIGFQKSKGEFFMYLDADMNFSDKNFVSKMLAPFRDDSKISGNFIRFVVNKKHPPLTRTLSYDEFQRDPILKFFTIGVNRIIKEKRRGYWMCLCSENNIPPQGLMIYRKKLVRDYADGQRQLIDNEIPAFLIKSGNNHFAFVPSTGVEHLLLRSLKELWKKRVRNLRRTYFPNVEERMFKWIDWRKDYLKILIWMIYTNSLIAPIINSIMKTIKYRDLCFLNEPVLNLVSTYSIIFGVLTSKK